MTAREPGLYADVAEVDYHSDTESLSVSGAKLLLQAPAIYRYRLEHPEHKDVFDLGSAAHKMVLGVGPDLHVVDADSWRTKAAQQERDAARARGAVPILTGDHQRVTDMADALTHHAYASALLAGKGAPEVSAYAFDDEGTGILRRGRFDWFGAEVLVDYKTTTSAEPEAFAAACARYGYDQQADWYLWLAEALDEQRDAYALIVQEKQPPYLVEVYELDDDALDRGSRRNRRALEIYQSCIEKDQWPGYTGRDHTTISLPRWAREDY